MASAVVLCSYKRGRKKSEGGRDYDSKRKNTGDPPF